MLSQAERPRSQLVGETCLVLRWQQDADIAMARV